MDSANDTFTAAEWREQSDSNAHLPQKYDSAVAIDPGKNTGLAACYPSGHLKTETLSFWEAIEEAEDLYFLDLPDPLYIVEAPYLTQWPKTQNSSPKAYSSGMVAREAALLVDGLERKGFDVVEHDPHSSGQSDWGDGKWDAKTARRIVGDWQGPDNGHTRDALKMLVVYGFAG